jgi:hypothetical protein
MKFTTSKRLTPCSPSSVTAGQSRSANIATSTFAPLSSFLPDDCTCIAARPTTRWKPSESVGVVSLSSGIGSISSSRKRSSFFLSAGASPPA